jgi:signal transduction histidine kinase/DNA-binding LacI/PurR family transcriptional regulator
MKTIGLFLINTESIYWNNVIRSIHKVFSASGDRLVCFVTAAVHARPGLDPLRNVLFDIVDPKSVDALIMSGAQTPGMNTAELLEFCQSFDPLPVVSMSVPLPCVPAVIADNTMGFSKLLDHVLNHHRYRRLAYIGGPSEHQEADIRNALFRSAMSQAGLEIPDDWIVYGDFSRISGERACKTLVQTLHDHPERPRFEGIIAANDYMAQGAQLYLESQGFKVPEDFFITGFDDLMESQYQKPGLTTVARSANQVAAQSAGLIMQMLAGQKVPYTVALDTQLVVRESCGCKPLDLQALDRESLLENLQSNRANLLTEVTERARIVGQMERMRATSESMMVSTSFDNFLEALERNLDQLGFDGYWFSLFADPRQPTGHSHLHLSKNPDGSRLRSERGLVFPSSELIPGGLRQVKVPGGLMVVEALYSIDRRLGFIVFATNPAGSQITSTLRGMISSALQAVLLLEERRRVERQMIQSEKMAALGSLVAGVAHEINTPLGIAITANSFLNERTTDFENIFNRDQVTRGNLKMLLQDYAMVGKSVQENLTRTANLVSSFKLISADQTNEHRRQFALKEYLEETLVSLQFQWRGRNINIELDGPAGLMVDTYPGTLVQIITNLIGNSLLHAFCTDAPGRINISLADEDAKVRLSFADDGCGIPLEYQTKVFEPFFTTKRGQGGTGLGLHVTYNLVTSILGGSISCSSKPGQGTVFEILFPRIARLTEIC